MQQTNLIKPQWKQIFKTRYRLKIKGFRLEILVIENFPIPEILREIKFGEKVIYSDTTTELTHIEYHQKFLQEKLNDYLLSAKELLDMVEVYKC